MTSEEENIVNKSLENQTLRIIPAKITKQFRIPCKTNLKQACQLIFQENLFKIEIEISGDTQKCAAIIFQQRWSCKWFQAQKR